MTIEEVSQRLYALDRRIRQRQFLYSATALTGPVGSCHILGINYNTGILYYKNAMDNWSPLVLGVSYTAPIQASYEALTEGETILNLPLAPGSILTWVVKGIAPLNPLNYTWNRPTFTLLNGEIMSQNEILSYQYITPL
jgi:hypothetical protein